MGGTRWGNREVVACHAASGPGEAFCYGGSGAAFYCVSALGLSVTYMNDAVAAEVHSRTSPLVGL